MQMETNVDEGIEVQDTVRIPTFQYSTFQNLGSSATKPKNRVCIPGVLAMGSGSNPITQNAPP